LLASRSISVTGSRGLRRFANERWRKILSPAPYLYLGIAAARPSNCYVTTASDSGWLLAGSRKAAFAGGPKIERRRSTRSRRNSSRSFSITACPIRPASRQPGGSYPELKLKLLAMPLPRSCNSTADTDPDWPAHPSCCERSSPSSSRH
jgi:hypothetical protein